MAWTRKTLHTQAQPPSFLARRKEKRKLKITTFFNNNEFRVFPPFIRLPPFRPSSHPVPRRNENFNFNFSYFTPYFKIYLFCALAVLGANGFWLCAQVELERNGGGRQAGRLIKRRSWWLLLLLVYIPNPGRCFFRPSHHHSSTKNTLTRKTHNPQMT